MDLKNLLLENMKESYQIYLDMDGVLCDFDARFEHFTGVGPREYENLAIKKYGEQKGKEKFWNLIDVEIGLRFWRGMPWMSEGKQLWEYTKQYKPILLTAPSKNQVSVEGKKLWVQDNIGEVEIVFKPAKEKPSLSGPNKILIDDREDTIQSWKQKNGIGLLYKGDTQEIIRELNKIGL